MFQNVNQPNPVLPPAHTSKLFLEPTASRVFPSTYNPWEICFNPLYYGLQSEQFSYTSPIPQPNIYLNFPNVPTISSNKIVTEASDSSAEAEIYTKTVRPGVTLRLRKPKFGGSTPSAEDTTTSSNASSSGNSGLDKETRKMIIRFLELNSKRKKPTRFGKDENGEELDNGEYVSFRNRSSASNTYSLPKFKYGNKREPVSVYDKAKFLTQLKRL